MERPDLLALERRFWQAAGDPDFYREHFAEDGRCVFAFGVLDKAATIASMEAAEPWSSFALDDAQVLELGPQVHAITYRARASRGGDAYAALVSSVYAERGGTWQLVLHHQLPAS